MCLARHRRNFVAHEGSYQIRSFKSTVYLIALAPSADISWKCPRCKVGIIVRDRNGISSHSSGRSSRNMVRLPALRFRFSSGGSCVSNPPTTWFRKKRRTRQLNASAAGRQITSSLSSADPAFSVGRYK